MFQLSVWRQRKSLALQFRAKDRVSSQVRSFRLGLGSHIKVSKPLFQVSKDEFKCKDMVSKLGFQFKASFAKYDFKWVTTQTGHFHFQLSLLCCIQSRKIKHLLYFFCCDDDDKCWKQEKRVHRSLPCLSEQFYLCTVKEFCLQSLWLIESSQWVKQPPPPINK